MHFNRTQTIFHAHIPYISTEVKLFYARLINSEKDGQSYTHTANVRPSKSDIKETTLVNTVLLNVVPVLYSVNEMSKRSETT